MEVVNFKMDKKTFWIIAGIVIAILVILVVWQTAQISTISASSGTAAKVASTTARASSGMVGGC